MMDKVLKDTLTAFKNIQLKSIVDFIFQHKGTIKTSLSFELFKQRCKVLTKWKECFLIVENIKKKNEFKNKCHQMCKSTKS